jgi:psiF repeat
MTPKMLLAVLGTFALLSAGTAHAQTAKKAPAPRTAKSIDCSKQADAKGLHGKERRKFRAACKKS